MTTSQTTMTRPIPYTEPAHQRVAQWLTEEAYLLDHQYYEAWLEQMTDDVRYLMPVRVTTARSAEFDTLSGMSHFDEDYFSLKKRVARFSTEHAWTEDPPSRLRHFVTNIRTFPSAAEGEFAVESYLLVYRSRGDVREPYLLSAGREDVLREQDGELKLARRRVEVDDSVLRMQNLGIFL
jgi:3-phenylpropionate/cinnamic acid dioxygenase small subunit